jgi:DNA-binding NtrC family response regulator
MSTECQSNQLDAVASTTKGSKPAPSNGAIQVLVIDDDPVALLAVTRHLKSRGFDVISADTGEAGLSKVVEKTSVALIDLRMPGLDGFACLKYLRENHPTIKVIMLTASSDIDDAVTAMKEGAFQYISKPFDPGSLTQLVTKAHEAWKVQQENTELREVLSFPEVPAKLPDEKSKCNANVLKFVKRISKLDSTVFLGGESGTGKTTVARLIHQHGHRTNGPFIAINCASLPRELIESELFGHAKGAYTGAVKDRIGKAELASGGTLFLDEIGDLPLELQPKLLTFLQERVIQRVGCNVVRPVDVRLIFATHHDLAKMCSEKRFRQDLYYRLNVLSLHLPPLRDRIEEVSEIAKSIVKAICVRQNRPLIDLSQEAIASLKSYTWPGNIRELENVLERAISFSEKQEISPEELLFDSVAQPLPQTTASAGPNTILAGMTLEDIEKKAILETLEHCQGNKAKTARMLGISEKSIYNKLKRHGLNKTSKNR